MDIIRERREQIIQENNTAQEQFKNILENLNKTAQKLRITEHLYGDLDFSILSEYGFSTIKDITLSKGEITNITGLPESVTALSCADNLLIELDNLPRGLLSIDIAHNYLSSIDVSHLQQLEVLNITDNKITSLENLPPSLMAIRCNNNQLMHLNLIGLANLELLHISNNPITVVENLPEGIVSFQMENTPDIEFRSSPVIPITNKSKKQVDDIEDTINYTESLNEYFHLKHNYEDKLFKMKKKIHEKATSKRAAQKQVLSITPACIKCKRPVGTTFSKKDNTYTAICGDAQNPCKLDIKIFAGTILPITWILYVMKESVEVLKDTIIKQKLDTLFNFISETDSVKIFKKNLSDYNSASQTYNELLEKQAESYHSSQKKELFDKKSGEIYKLIEQIRKLLEEYEKTQNRELLKTAMHMQIKELLPETRNLRNIKNEVMEMHANKMKTDVVEHSLFQYPCTLSKIDDVFGEPPRVIKFVK